MGTPLHSLGPAPALMLMPLHLVGLEPSASVVVAVFAIAGLGFMLATLRVLLKQLGDPALRMCVLAALTLALAAAVPFILRRRPSMTGSYRWQPCSCSSPRSHGSGGVVPRPRGSARAIAWGQTLFRRLVRIVGSSLAAWSYLAGLGIGFTGYYNLLAVNYPTVWAKLEKVSAPLSTAMAMAIGHPVLASVAAPNVVTSTVSYTTFGLGSASFLLAPNERRR